MAEHATAGRTTAATAGRLPPLRQRGVALLGLLVMVAVVGAGLAAIGTIWHAEQQRVKEAELIFVGMQVRNAIRQYYENSPGPKVYPRSLEALLRDDRFPGIKRYLRRPYRDPLTNSPQWGVVKGPDGGIMGIYSLAPGRPRKEANFPAILGWVGGRSSYADWQFVYLPPSGVMGF